LLNCGLILAAQTSWAMTCRAQESNSQAGDTGSAGNPSDHQKKTAATLSTEDQEEQPDEQALAGNDNTLGTSFLKNLITDQKLIWTSPIHIRFADGAWLFPLATVTGVFLATDRSMAKAVSKHPSNFNRYQSVSNYGVAALGGVSAGFYLFGKISHDEHKRETGLLAAEAAINSVGVNTVLQYSLGRERPNTDQGKGLFFQGGTSFPSDHSVAAWSIASVIAHEYPGTLTKLLAYGVATGVSVSRVAGEEHFPSDVLVGSTIGWLIGREVYRIHHDPELGGSSVGNLAGYKDDEGRRDRRSMGSPFVPMDSWVYPAIERLAGFGYVMSAIMGQKPWTRMECARLTEEAGDSLQDNPGSNSSAEELQGRLQEEFAYEVNLLSGGTNLTANIESVYARAISISGPALTDGFHFGQTVSNDFGRPFERGTSGQAGGSISAAAGPLTIYVRTEYQHSPSAPGLSNSLRNFESIADQVPLAEVPAGPVAATNRPELLDAYAAVNMGNWQLSIGRQTLSWGPTPDPMIWSDNIEPLGMIRLSNPEPFHLPGFFRYLGGIRIDEFIGRLDGHSYIPNPFIYGQKFNFKPVPFLEIGIGRTTYIGGQGGDAFTTGNFVRSFFGLVPRNYVVNNHGASQSELDWTFSLPGLRNYIVFYGDSYASDDVLPIARPLRNPWEPGIYITRIPGISKLDLHMQAVSTEGGGIAAGINNNVGNFDYWDFTYHDGYTNDRFLIGNTVGRDGRAFQTWLTYWLSSRNTLQFMYKHNIVSGNFIPGGGAWQDYAVKNETYLKNGFYIKAELQYENISRYPILFDGPQRNLTGTLEVGFYPQRKTHAKVNGP
jgi:membrane-associated phospholipid phosphatase